MPRWLFRISIVLLILSVVLATASVAAIVWASRADLLNADAIWVPGHPVICWHDGLDYHMTICNYVPPAIPGAKVDPTTGEILIPFQEYISGPYWRLDSVAFEMSLWKPLIVTAGLSVLWCMLLLLSRKRTRRRGFEILPAARS